jgi:hypothetical protein
MIFTTIFGTIRIVVLGTNAGINKSNIRIE